MADTVGISAAQADFLKRFLGFDPRNTGAPPPEPVSLVALQKARLLYSRTLSEVQSELKALEAAIIRTFKDEHDAAEMAKNAKIVYSVLGSVDTRLIDQLDAAYNAQAPADRARALSKCVKIIDVYIKSLNANPIFGILDDNPIHPVSVQKTLEKTLSALRERLG